MPEAHQGHLTSRGKKISASHLSRRERSLKINEWRNPTSGRSCRSVGPLACLVQSRRIDKGELASAAVRKASLTRESLTRACQFLLQKWLAVIDQSARLPVGLIRWLWETFCFAKRVTLRSRVSNWFSVIKATWNVLLSVCAPAVQISQTFWKNSIASVLTMLWMVHTELNCRSGECQPWL